MKSNSKKMKNGSKSKIKKTNQSNLNNKKSKNSNKNLSKNINVNRRTNEKNREYVNENEYNVFRDEKNKSINKKINKKKNINKTTKVNKNRNNKLKNNFDGNNNENKKMNNRGKLTICFVLIISILCLIVATMLSPLFAIKNIKIVGNDKITDETIISLSGIQIGENTYKINKKYIKKNILENAFISDVKIKRNLPSTIEIIVEERKATFAIEYGGGYIYINNQGYILELSENKSELPILQGTITSPEKYIPNNRLDVEDLNKLSTVIKIMEIAENTMISEIGLNIASIITRIDIENIENYKILIESQGKIVHLGNEMNLNDKLLNVSAIIGKTIGTSGEIFVNMDLTKQNPIFRENV